MSLPSFLQYALFVVVLVVCVKPVGLYLFKVFAHQSTPLDRVLCPVERFIYRAAGVDHDAEMDWKQYTFAFMLFGILGTILHFAVLLVQHWFPWYVPAYLTTPMTVDLALNTATSFSTTTTWQAYGGETAMSYFSQVVGLAAQNFLAGARDDVDAAKDADAGTRLSDHCPYKIDLRF